VEDEKDRLLFFGPSLLLDVFLVFLEQGRLELYVPRLVHSMYVAKS
jgi:hypothetical protein